MSPNLKCHKISRDFINGLLTASTTLWPDICWLSFQTRVGGTIFYFSVNIRDRFPGPMVLNAFCHNKTENNFEKFEN